MKDRQKIILLIVCCFIAFISYTICNVIAYETSKELSHAGLRSSSVSLVSNLLIYKNSLLVCFLLVAHFLLIGGFYFCRWGMGAFYSIIFSLILVPTLLLVWCLASCAIELLRLTQ